MQAATQFCYTMHCELQLSGYLATGRCLRDVVLNSCTSAMQVRLDCYRVSLTPFKAYVEEMMKRLRDALGASLRKKVGWGRAAGMS